MVPAKKTPSGKAALKPVKPTHRKTGKPVKRVAKKAKTPAKKPKSAGRSAKPAVKKGKTVVKKSQIVAKKAKPMVKKAKPAAKKNKAVARKSKPMVKKSKITAKKSKPAVKKPKPAAKKSKPAVKKPKLAVKRAKPAVKKPKLAVKRAKPAVKKPRPAVKKATGKTPKTKGKKVAAKKAAARKAAPQKIARKPVVPKAAQKPAQETAARQEELERRAYGFYDGVLVCERPKLLPKATPYTETEVESLRNILQRERTRLREVLRDLDQLTFNIGEEPSGAVPGYSIHLAEDATNNIDTETALLLRRDEEEGLMQVEAALDRLETGLFGVCVACGCRIGMNRLKVVPETHLCMECKTVYDRKSANR